MTEQKISKARLILNGIGCLGIAILCLPIGISGIVGLASTPLGTDPDGGDKVLAIEIFCGLLGATAFISLVRTVKIWRGLHEEYHIVRAERAPPIPIAKGKGDNGMWEKWAKWTPAVIAIVFVVYAVKLAMNVPQSYRIKTKMAGAIMLGQNAAVAVDNYEHEHHQIPKNLEQTGFAETLPAVVRKIAFDSQRGVVAVTMSIVPIEGKTLLMVSSKDASGKTQWKCMSQEIQKEYLPQGCQQNN